MDVLLSVVLTFIPFVLGIAFYLHKQKMKELEMKMEKKLEERMRKR